MAGPWRIVQRNSKSEGEFASDSRTPKIVVEPAEVSTVNTEEEAALRIRKAVVELVVV